MQDKSDLSHAIEVFGAKTVAGALDKNPAVKKKSCEEIKKIVGEYSPYGEYGIKYKPPKMLKASTQITARLIRDKVTIYADSTLSLLIILEKLPLYANRFCLHLLSMYFLKN